MALPNTYKICSKSTIVLTFCIEPMRRASVRNNRSKVDRLLSDPTLSEDDVHKVSQKTKCFCKMSWSSICSTDREVSALAQQLRYGICFCDCKSFLIFTGVLR